MTYYYNSSIYMGSTREVYIPRRTRPPTST